MKKILRITSTLPLQWPQLGFELFPTDSGKTNDFDGPEALPEGLMPKLKGFLRSGQVRMFVLTLGEDGSVAEREDVTPTAEELDEADAEEAEDAEPADPSLEPATPATPSAPSEPAPPES